ncbi:MAG: hypothetical protein ACE361_12220 [Aureliella sp.]
MKFLAAVLMVSGLFLNNGLAQTAADAAIARADMVAASQSIDSARDDAKDAGSAANTDYQLCQDRLQYWQGRGVPLAWFTVDNLVNFWASYYDDGQVIQSHEGVVESLMQQANNVSALADSGDEAYAEGNYALACSYFAAAEQQYSDIADAFSSLENELVAAGNRMGPSRIADIDALGLEFESQNNGGGYFYEEREANRSA